MSKFSRIVCLLALVILSGCDSSSDVATDPTKLAPLTDAQKAEMAATEKAVEDEERGTPVPAPGKKAK
ncbi:MAG: hypothetical protein SFX72_10725 [Isosphaeraceae bacterium]|nr:hypothetical protein [Isosphaeraceae bacterium]